MEEERKPTHFAVYRLVKPHPDNTLYKYVFSTGTAEELKAIEKIRPTDKNEFFERIKIRRIPKPFLSEMQRIARLREIPPGKITGEMEYKVENGIVENFYCYPKKALGANNVKGLGYWLEAITTRDLQREGVTHVKADLLSMPPRVGQLYKARLTDTRTYTIEAWLHGMGIGIRKRLRGEE